MSKKFNAVKTLVAVAAIGGMTAANAALPTGVTAALADIGTDSIALATTVLLAVVGVFAIKFLRKGL